MQYLGTQCMEFVTETFVVQLDVIGDDVQIYSLYKFLFSRKLDMGILGRPELR